LVEIDSSRAEVKGGGEGKQTAESRKQKAGNCTPYGFYSLEVLPWSHPLRVLTALCSLLSALSLSPSLTS
jgi:hypothetical protein